LRRNTLVFWGAVIVYLSKNSGVHQLSLRLK